MASAADEQEAAACCAAVLEAMREPGFRTVCVDSLLGPTAGGLLFVECPLAALKTVAKLLPMTADRAPEQRFKPLLARARAVATSEVHLVRAQRRPPLAHRACSHRLAAARRACARRWRVPTRCREAAAASLAARV
jgi:hypothetical protein